VLVLVVVVAAVWCVLTAVVEHIMLHFCDATDALMAWSQLHSAAYVMSAAGDVVTLIVDVFFITKNGGDGNRGGICLR
jgi:hypothetical protein